MLERMGIIEKRRIKNTARTRDLLSSSFSKAAAWEWNTPSVVRDIHRDNKHRFFWIPKNEKSFLINFSILLRSNALTTKKIILKLTGIEMGHISSLLVIITIFVKLSFFSVGGSKVRVKISRKWFHFALVCVLSVQPSLYSKRRVKSAYEKTSS